MIRMLLRISCCVFAGLGVSVLVAFALAATGSPKWIVFILVAPIWLYVCHIWHNAYQPNDKDKP